MTCHFLSFLTSSQVNPIQHVPDCRPGYISSYRAPFHVVQKGFCLFFNFLMIYGINSLQQAQILLRQIESNSSSLSFLSVAFGLGRIGCFCLERIERDKNIGLGGFIQFNLLWGKLVIFKKFRGQNIIF